MAGKLLFSACNPAPKKETLVQANFIKIGDLNLIAPDGEKFIINGTNLVNWLNPEG